MTSIYIHIPFCKSICAYCDFTKILYRKEKVNTYLEALEKEIADAYKDEEVRSIYIGGGTPSCLSAKELLRLKDILGIFKKSDDCEFTFECNIEDIDEELLSILKDMEVNRLSIGIESFNTSKLKFMKRKANFKDTMGKMKLMRSMGFENINVDLMYGIPGERLKDTKRDLKQFLKLEPDHISTYSLIIEEHTMCKIRNDENIDPSEEIKMYNYIVKKLSKKGYVHYEVSNFALPDCESVHNLNYWDNGEYYGFGLGASGYIDGFRYTNTMNLDEYSAGNYRMEENLISRTEMMENEVMLGLRKMKGINLQEFFDKYEVNLQDVFPVKPLIKNRELIYSKGYIFINPKYIYVMNEILLKLI